MQKWVALLKGINVGGNNVIKMADLKASATRAGLEDFQTYIQSGNCIFSADEDVETLTQKLHQLIADDFGLDIAVLVLPLDKVTQILAANPISIPDEHDNKLQIHFCWTMPDQGFLNEAKALATDTETFELIDDVLYLYAPDGIGRSKLFEKLPQLIGIEVTVRNLRTMNKLLSLN